MERNMENEMGTGITEGRDSYHFFEALHEMIVRLWGVFTEAEEIRNSQTLWPRQRAAHPQSQLTPKPWVLPPQQQLDNISL